MGVVLTIRDETSSGEVIAENSMQFSVKFITVKELIKARVEQEAEVYNTATNGEFNGLVQPNESEKMLNGFRMSSGKRVDSDRQVKVAIRAFQSNEFFLLVNDQQLTELEDIILVTPNTVVSFLKLVPLVGG
jgi:hypothetical protein